jgi:hypothetical protein
MPDSGLLSPHHGTVADISGSLTGGGLTMQLSGYADGMLSAACCQLFLKRSTVYSAP